MSPYEMLYILISALMLLLQAIGTLLPIVKARGKSTPPKYCEFEGGSEEREA